MVEEERHGVTVDVCACGGVWLDGGELEELIRRRLDARADPGEPRKEDGWLDGDLWPLDIVLEVVVGVLDW